MHRLAGALVRSVVVLAVLELSGAPGLAAWHADAAFSIPFPPAADQVSSSAGTQPDGMQPYEFQHPTDIDADPGCLSRIRERVTLHADVARTGARVRVGPPLRSGRTNTRSAGSSGRLAADTPLRV